VDGVGQRVLGHQPQGRGHVAELDVQVDQHGRLRRRRGQPDRQVGGDRRLADPALGRGHGDDPAGVARGVLERAQCPPAARRGSGGPLDGRPDLLDARAGLEHVADAGAHGRLPQLGLRAGDEHHADPGALHVEPGGQAEHLRRRRTGADEQHLGELPVGELLEQPGRVAGEPAVGQHQQVAAGGGGHPPGQLVVGRGEHDAAHE
jgi:hypothetical protein